MAEKDFLSGHRREIIENACETGLQHNPVAQGFWPWAKTPLRAGLYARISTHDQHTLSLQRRAVRDYAARRGWTIAIDVKEVGSGASVRELRQKVLDAARRRDRCRHRLAPGSLGTLHDRSGDDTPGELLLAQHSLELAHWPEHTNDCSTRVERDAMIIAIIIAFSVLGIGMLLLVYGTVVKNRWGVNLMPISCPRCNIPLPQIRQPKTVRQALWGGGTCAACGTELDKWGRELTSQRRRRGSRIEG